MILTDTGENVQKWTRVFSTRRRVILVARTRRKKRRKYSRPLLAKFACGQVSSPRLYRLRLYSCRVKLTRATYDSSLILVRRGIAAYRVGCENAKAPHIGDINDQYGDWDYSNDVISKAKYYAKHVFNK